MKLNHFLFLNCSLEKLLLVEWFFNYNTRSPCIVLLNLLVLGKFTWVRAIIFWGNFMVRGEGGEQFSSWSITLGGQLSRGQLCGGQSSRRQLSGWQFSGADFPRGQENSHLNSYWIFTWELESIHKPSWPWY